MEELSGVDTWEQRWPNASSEEVMVDSDINPRYPNGIVVGLLMLTGLTGNSLVLYIYHFKMEHTVFTTFVTFLAGLDLTTTLVGMPLDVVIKTLMVQKTDAMEIMCKVVHFEVYTSSLASGSILLLIAATRHSKVCKPTQRGWTVRQARVRCLVILLVSAVLCTVSLVINGLEPTKISLGVRQRSSQPLEGGNFTHNSSLHQHTHPLYPPGGNLAQNFSMWTNETVTSNENDKTLHLGNLNPNPNLPTEKTTQKQDSKAGSGGSDGIQARFDRRHEGFQSLDAPHHTNVSQHHHHYRTQTEVVQVYVCRASQQQKGTTLYYGLYGLLVTAYVTICLSLAILHCRIACTLLRFRRRQQYRRGSLGCDQDHTITQRMFRIFAAITVIFVLSYLPHLACIVVQRVLFRPGEAMPRVARVLLDLAYNCPYINVVANPFIYGYMSKRFRAYCLHYLCWSCDCRGDEYDD